MVSLKPGDALIIADIQNDFLPGGALGIQGGDAILPALQTYVARFHSRSLPVFLSRDWHPPHHCSFRDQGGPWPVHCLAGSPGSLPPSGFDAPLSAVVIYKAIDVDHEAYSAFHHTLLHRHLEAIGVQRLFIGGLATDYCVLNTVKDALSLNYEVCLLMDGIRAVNLEPEDGRRAEEEMIHMGSIPVRLKDISS